MNRFLRVLSMVLMSSMMLTASAEGTSVFTDKMIEHSLVSVGNNERFRRAAEKARAGEEVTLAYLGGSITEGALAQPQRTKCYAYVSCEIFKEKYASNPENVRYVNAGISGTPSLLGLTRLEKDILSKSPDIVFVEFAVNDSTDPKSKIVYESLVRRLIASETEPAVILIFTMMNSGYNAQPHMQQVGKHYDLGMISIKNAISPEITLGNMTFADYSSDYAHPTTEGHAFIADMIGYYFDKATEGDSAPYEIPQDTVYGNDYEALINIEKGDPEILDRGSFLHGVYPCYTYLYGWKRTGGANKPMTLKIGAKSMTIAYRQEKNTSCGRLEIVVDGEVVKTINGYDDGAWGNIVTDVIDFEDSKERTIELRMAQGDESKSFTIYDIAYVK
ncbi:MAG: SGNH/GDSL hydrolase family protein [Clostridia bacterium]|nr:SGNH/GDSL hydrolase family protein [Clostridia bacterium]